MMQRYRYFAAISMQKLYSTKAEHNYGFLTIIKLFESRNEHKASIIKLVKGKHSCFRFK